MHCIYSSYCKEANEVHCKLGAQIILRGLAGLTIDSDNVPYNNEGVFQNTIVEAPAVQSDPGLQLERD